MAALGMGRPSGRKGRRLRLPLSFVVGRYFLYVLAGSLFVVGIPLLMFVNAMLTGGVYAANYGDIHLDEVREALIAQEEFDAAAIPSAYGYARFSADGTELLEGDVGEVVLAQAREAVRGLADEGSELFPPATRARFEAVPLADGTICVLSYNLMPQWASREMRDAWMNPQDLLILVMGVGVVALVALVAWRASSVLTRKMAPLMEAAAAVGRQDLDAPVGASNVAQVDDVLSAMDEMRLSLKRSLEEQMRAEARQREQIGALAHDLKTPLTIIRGNADLLLEDAQAGALGEEQAASAEAIVAAAQRTDAFVAGIIAASRGAAAGLRLREVPVADVEAGLVEAARALADARGCALEVGRSSSVALRSVSGAVALSVDLERLTRAVLNLVGNACDHAPTGSTVRLRFGVRDGSLAIAVEDEGPGFSPEALAHGAERFFRDAEAREQNEADGEPHFGLGLFIADEVVRAHGGELLLENRETGGARVTLLLPVFSG